MKPSEAPATGNVVALKPARLRRAETEFLPAALEITEAPASPLGRAIALSISAFVVVAILWASFGKVDIIATAQGRIIPTGKSKVVQPYEVGVVRRIAVADGSRVSAGDVLVELDPTSDASDEARSKFGLMADELDIDRLRALLDSTLDAFNPKDAAEPRMVAMARRQMDAQASEQAAKLDGFDRQIAQKRAEGRETKASIEKITMSVPLITEQRDIRQSLLQNQYGSRLTYLQVQQQLIESQHDLEGQKQKLEETEQALGALEKQKLEAVAGYRKGLLTDLEKAELSSIEHTQDIRKATLHRDLRTLRAPVGGTVQELALHTVGGIVTPAQQLMVIVPEDGGIEIEANLENKDVGFVRVAQPVEIKIEAFNFTRYGLLRGTVSSLSRDAVDPQNPGRHGQDQSQDTGDEKDAQSRQPAYVAHVKLDAISIATENGDTKLEPGMAVTAEIKTGRRSVISFLMSPLTKLRQEAMRER